MSAIPVNTSKFADNFLNVGVPLAVLAVACVFLNISVGSVFAIAAATLAAVLTTITTYFGESHLLEMLGTETKGLSYYLVMGAVTALVTLFSVGLVGLVAL